MLSVVVLEDLKTEVPGLEPTVAAAEAQRMCITQELQTINPLVAWAMQVKAMVADQHTSIHLGFVQDQVVVARVVEQTSALILVVAQAAPDSILGTECWLVAAQVDRIQLQQDIQVELAVAAVKQAQLLAGQ